MNSERIKRGQVIQDENVSNNDEKLSDEGWVERPPENSQSANDDITDINVKPEIPSEIQIQHNKTSQQNLQIGNIVVDATKAIAGVISTIAGGVVQATEGIVSSVYRPIGNFTFGPRENCKLRVSDDKTHVYKDTEMNCVAMQRLIREVENAPQKEEVKVSDVAVSELKCVFIRTKVDTRELEKLVDCGHLQAYTQKFSH